MLLKSCFGVNEELQGTHRFCETRAVILSGAIASHREATTESKDPYLSTGVSRNRHRPCSRCKDAGRDELAGVLRLRNWFAKRTSCCAQD